MTRLIVLILGCALWCLPSLAQAPAKGKDPKAVAKAADLIDINSATADQLKAIPGIGEAYSKRIIDGRPYARKDELVAKKILPEGVYEKVKDAIIARQGSAKKK